MSFSLKPISPAEFWDLFPEAPLRLAEFVDACVELLAWFYDGVPLCVWGLCKVTWTTDEISAVYAWGWNTPAVTDHRVAYARTAMRLTRDYLRRFPILVGHCHVTKQRYLRSLGAVFYAADGDMLNFMIKAQP